MNWRLRGWGKFEKRLLGSLTGVLLVSTVATGYFVHNRVTSSLEKTCQNRFKSTSGEYDFWHGEAHLRGYHVQLDSEIDTPDIAIGTCEQNFRVGVSANHNLIVHSRNSLYLVDGNREIISQRFDSLQAHFDNTHTLMHFDGQQRGVFHTCEYTVFTDGSQQELGCHF